MKILQEKYPKGSYHQQKTDGKYIDGYLYQNLDLLASKIVDDMTFMAVCFSSTLEVGTGKSVLVSQIGEAWTHLMKKKHDIDVPFNSRNCVFKPEDLIERSFELPKYSFIWLDEWEDAHYWSKLGMTLRQFFRKCRQLNLFMMVIIPNFFELRPSYAISRSVFAIDVKFDENLDRGYFDFYNFRAKKDLYVKGKKTQNYKVQRADFSGRFVDGYGIPEPEYRRAKYLDMVASEKKEVKKKTEIQVRNETISTIYNHFKGRITQKEIGEAFELDRSTVSHLLNEEVKNKRGYVEDGSGGSGVVLDYTTNPKQQNGLSDGPEGTEELKEKAVAPNI